MIKFNNLNKYYNKGKKNQIHVLKDISYEFPNTGLITFLGESGSGKTTLLNLIGGLLYSEDSIYHDDIKFNKNNINELDNYRNKNIGFIFQNYLLLNDETVYDNLRLALEVCGIFDKDEQEKRIVETLKALKIYRYRKKLAGKLSGGEQQRVSIARAIVKGAKVLLCDEPTGNLDKKNGIKVMDILKAISKNTLVILVTHNKELANFYSDKIINMKDGIIVSDSDMNAYTLDTTYTDTIYLGELENKQIEDKLNVNYYTDNSKDVSLRVILKNGHLYVESNLPTEIVLNNNVDIREGVAEHITNESFSNEFKFDDFNNIYGNDYSFFDLFKKCFKKKNKTKKIRFFNRISLLLGMIVTAFSLLTVYSLNTTVSNSYYNEGFYTIFTEEYPVSDMITESLNKGYITDLLNQTDFRIVAPYFEEKYTYNSLNANMVEYYGQELLIGKIPDSEGVVIGQREADMIKKNYDITYDEILNVTLVNSNQVNLKINGILKGGKGVFYDKSIDHKLTYSKIFNLIDINDHSKYKIIEEDPNVYGNVIYVEKSSGYFIGENVNNLFVKGYIEEINDLDDVVVTNKTNYPQINQLGRYTFLKENTNIVEGRKPETMNEILAPIGYANLGDQIKNKVVVGLYDNDIRETNCTFIGHDQTVKNSFSSMDLEDAKFFYANFKIKDLDNFMQIFNKYKMEGMELFNDRDLMTLNRFSMTQLIIIFMFVFLLITTSIYIYFIKRSEIIVDHYNLTVLRSMGATKKYIYKRYLVYNLFDSLKTITLGSVIVFVTYYFVTLKMNNILLESLNLILLLSFLLTSYFLIALIPLRNILKKEPAYLTSKYDI